MYFYMNEPNNPDLKVDMSQNELYPLEYIQFKLPVICDLADLSSCDIANIKFNLSHNNFKILPNFTHFLNVTSHLIGTFVLDLSFN